MRFCSRWVDGLHWVKAAYGMGCIWGGGTAFPDPRVLGTVQSENKETRIDVPGHDRHERRRYGIRLQTDAFP